MKRLLHVEITSRRRLRSRVERECQPPAEQAPPHETDLVEVRNAQALSERLTSLERDLAILPVALVADEHNAGVVDPELALDLDDPLMQVGHAMVGCITEGQSQRWV